jgi:predicted acyl esterase
MNILRIFLTAVIAIVYCAQTTDAQYNKGRDNYQYLKLLPRYDNNGSFQTDSGLDSVTRFDFTVVLRDGTILDALKFIPVGTPPAGGWPTVIFVHGYGDNKETLAGFAKSQAQYGYYTTTFSMRGQGNSTGLSNLISSIEAQDMIEFVASVKRDSVNGSSPNNILIMGGSQGGLVPYHACALGMNVRTIISALAPPNYATSWIENGSIKMTFLWTIEYNSDTARYTPQVDRMSNWVYGNNKPYWDSLAFWLPKGRDFMGIVQNNKVPLIMEGSWQDKFFNASGIMLAAQNNVSSPFKLYLGAVQGHGGDNSPTEDQWHMQFFNDWFLYWLFGQQNGVLDRAKYDYASTTHPVNGLYWTFNHDSSKVPFTQLTTPYRLYFNTSSRLTKTPNTSTTTRSTLRNQVTGGLTMQEAVNEEFTGSTFNSKFVKRNISYTSGVLSGDMKWLGTPKINIDYLSTASTFVQYNFQIYEVKPDGTQKLINRVNYTDRNYTANTRKTKDFEGQAHSHIFKAGNRIRVTITNLDTSPDDQWFLGTNPFVLPTLNNGYHYVYLSSKSYIDLPVVSLTSPPFSDSEEGSINPYKYSLSQNYPNPFNPVTTIKYTLAGRNLVTVKIFDILGREVNTLVNEIKDAGNYDVMFDASHLASGVYFYTIKSGSFTDTKKMLLIK